MGQGYETMIRICTRQFEAVLADLDKPEAQRTTEMLIAQGFLARYRVYRDPDSSEKRYVVYSAQPRRGTASQPIESLLLTH